MSDRKIFISKRCNHSVKLLVGLSKHDLLRYFDIINVDVSGVPNFINSVPTLFHNGKTITGEPLFNYLNEFATKMLSANKKEPKEKALDEELEPWCPNGGCAIGFSEINESDDNFKDMFHKDAGGLCEINSIDSCVPDTHESGDQPSKRAEDFNKQYEEFMNSRK